MVEGEGLEGLLLGLELAEEQQLVGKLTTEAVFGCDSWTKSKLRHAL